MYRLLVAVALCTLPMIAASAQDPGIAVRPFDQKHGGSKSVHKLGHVVNHPGPWKAADIELEQDADRPYVYVCGFVNFDVGQVVDDLNGFIERLRSVNPAARIVLTVSPVPLAATAENRHVLESTVLSKSVLRVAADMVQRAHGNVAYFPSYELITGAFNRGAYYDTDLRTVLPAGVEHVMSTFFRAYLPDVEFKSSSKPRQNSVYAHTPRATPPADGTARLSAVEMMVELICEEDELDPEHKS